ncbi:MAG TPA: hypothetical protein VHQ65_00980 [Thermoanaerobaculia bacterium]|nr:hypothetical protein [Thermoanaerobaculia bacterium]
MTDEVAAVVQLTIALVLVTAYTLSRYNTPRSIRSETTWEKFMFGRLAYLAIVLLVFMLLLATPELIADLVEETTGTAARDMVSNARGALSFPLIVALFLTVFLSEVPGLSRLDAALRGYFHRMAAIPRERRYWIGVLSQADALPDQQHQEGATPFRLSGSVGATWERIVHLMSHLKRLEANRRYQEYLFRDDSYSRVIQDYEKQAERALHIHQLSQERQEDRAIRMLHKDFGERAAVLLQAIYDLESRLLLHCERSAAQRRTCLRTLGLQDPPEPEPRTVDLHEILWLLLLLAVFYTLALGRLDGSVVGGIVLSNFAACLIAIAVADAVGRGKAPPRRSFLPPVGRYLLAGILALATALAIAVARRLLDQPFQEAVRRLGEDHRWVWSLMPLVLATGIVALADDWMDQLEPSPRARFAVGNVLNFLDATILALLLAGVMSLFVLPAVKPEAALLPGALRAAGAGALIGVWLPSVLRGRLRERREKAAGRRSGMPPLPDPTGASAG